MRQNVVLLFLLISLCYVNGLKILCLAPIVAHSHHITVWRLAQILAERDHDVTFVAATTEDKPTSNIRTLHLTGFKELFDEHRRSANLFSRNQNSPFIMIPSLGQFGLYITKETFSHEVVQKLLKSNEKFDVVIMEQFVVDGLRAIAHHFGAHLVLISGQPPSTWTNHLVGNPDIPSYMPHVFLDSTVHKSFFKRTYNTLLYIYQRSYEHFFFYPKQNQIIQQILPNSPPISELLYNTSLILFNTDLAYSYALPKTPNMIEIGGYHVQSPNKLPEDLQNILDNARDGVIYFSLGSNLKSKELPPPVRLAILKSLGKLGKTVLWKYEEDLPGKPTNVIIRSWFPQIDILAHPNVKLFITHGGLLSTIESLFYGVPVVGIPVFGDQQLNMANFVARGYGVSIDFSELSESRLSWALQEVFTNPKYTKNAKEGSQILRNKRVNQADTAEYWIRYIVKHEGAKHLRPASLELTWYQHISLDVILFLVAIDVIVCVVIYKIIRWLLGRNKPPRKQKTG